MPGFNRKPTRPASGRTAVARNSSATGLTAEMVRRELHRPFSPQELAQERARAAWEQRYQQITRSGRAYARSATVARQDGPFAYYAQAQLRAELKYQAQTNQRLAIEKAATQQAVANQTYIRQGSTKEEQKRGRAEAGRQQVARNLGELMRNNPETTGIAVGTVIGSVVAANIIVPEMAALRLAGTARLLVGARTLAVLSRSRAATTAWRAASAGRLGMAEAEVFGARASYSALRTAPAQFGWAATTRVGLDVGAQYGANVALGNGWGKSFGQINVIETGMAAVGIRPIGISVGSAAFQLSGTGGFQTIFHSVESGHRVSLSRFAAQAGVGMAFGYAGGYAEQRLAGYASSKAWARYTYMLHVRNPRWATSAASVGLHAGQEYGVPLGIGIGEETGEGLAGDKADSLGGARP